MGAYAPASILTPELLATATARILEPVIQAMNKEGHPYTGVLYAGLMLTKNGPEVVEFNVRFGDPETQVILPLLETDLVEVISAVLAGNLAGVSLSWRQGAAACVVLASGGYPGSYKTGQEITGLEEAAGLEDLLVFHAGTERKEGAWRTSGGRVLNLVGVGATLPEALDKAYRGAELIRFPVAITAGISAGGNSSVCKGVHSDARGLFLGLPGKPTRASTNIFLSDPPVARKDFILLQRSLKQADNA